MKQFLASFLLLSTWYLVLGTMPVKAVICNPVLKDCTASTDPETYTNNVVRGVISIFFIVAIIYFFWHLIFAGLHLMSTDGDSKKFETAKNELTNSIVGVIVVFSVFAIIKFVGTVLGIQGLENLTITWPTL